MKQWKLMDRVVFDTETTGFGPEARIIEIATVERRYPPFSGLINPGPIDWDDPEVAQAMSVNKIDREELAEAPTFARCWPRIRGIFEGSPVWVGHHVAFDVRMLQQELQRMGKTLDPPEMMLDTVVIDHALNPGCETYRLDAVRERWAIGPFKGHRAVIDTMLCGWILERMMSKLPDDFEEMKQIHAEWEEKWKQRRRQRDEQRRQEEQKP